MTYRLDPHNANRGTLRGIGALEASLGRTGAGRSIVTDRHRTILAGNKTFAAAQALGIPVREVHTTGTELVVVVREDLDAEIDPRARELALADNRTAELDLDWEPDEVIAAMELGIDLGPYWNDQELEEWLIEAGKAIEAEQEGDGSEDSDSNPSYSVQEGEVWSIPATYGVHRVVCGDPGDPACYRAALDPEELATTEAAALGAPILLQSVTLISPGAALARALEDRTPLIAVLSDPSTASALITLAARQGLTPQKVGQL